MDPRRCVFHLRTPATAGVLELLPLAALRHRDPEAYERGMAGYDGTPARRRLRDTWIPGLEARWTEVVFLSPIRPQALWRTWREVTGTELPSQEFWAIPVEDIGPAVVLDRRESCTGEALLPQEVEALDVERYRSAPETTARNRDWLAQLAREGRRGAWFQGTPHVLTRGPVPLARAEVTDWRGDA